MAHQIPLSVWQRACNLVFELRDIEKKAADDLSELEYRYPRTPDEPAKVCLRETQSALSQSASELGHSLKEISATHHIKIEDTRKREAAMNEHERTWTNRAIARHHSMKGGEKRMAQEDRRCPVKGCKEKPLKYSRYCAYHARRLKEQGHPTLDLRVGPMDRYGSCLKLGRWVREAMSRDDQWQDDPSSRAAWLRIEQALEAFGKDHSLKHPIPVLAQKEGQWRTSYKAKCALSRQLERKSPEEVLAAYLGLVSVVIVNNDLLVTSAQLKTMMNKAGARAALRQVRLTGVDPHSGRKHKWKPSPGTYTKAGKLIFDLISKELSANWFKQVELKIIKGKEAGNTPTGPDATPKVTEGQRRAQQRAKLDKERGLTGPTPKKSDAQRAYEQSLEPGQVTNTDRERIQKKRLQQYRRDMQRRLNG
ncbi:MAG: hypothetical protein AAFY35_04215 [Pseudomonadota bacterium]